MALSAGDERLSYALVKGIGDFLEETLPKH
jgi:hypothetical protein